MSEKRYLISIGINDYEINPLDYCCKDATDISVCFESHCNVDHDEVYLITSEEKKPNVDIYSSLIKAVDRIKSTFIQNEDSISFYFSGHGTRKGKSTAMVVHNGKIIELQDIFNILSSLKPKFIFCLVDACYSGIGIEDSIGKSDNELQFSQHLKLASGYSIICASAEDKTAKEDLNIQNGRLTRFFIDIIQNQSNYSDGILNLSKIYQLIDKAFKDNPTFRQHPFTQNKGLSTYPLAFLEENAGKYYSTHYIDDIEEYDWSFFKNELSEYCRIDSDIINEFTRLVRELLRNSKKWGGATFLKVEIGNGTVSVYDNSGTFFDIFNPPDQIKLNGGGKTAAAFKSSFIDEFDFSIALEENATIQIFKFKNKIASIDICRWTIKTPFELWEIQRGSIFEIPENCNDFTIYIPQGGLDLSTVHTSLNAFIAGSNKADKPITIIISENDRLKKEFIESLEFISKSIKHKVIIK